jgi:DNA-binding SARP family transcriptional activator/tetratricopeptide (TPR) repeat protein
VIRVRALGSASIELNRKRLTPKSDVMFALAIYACVRAGDHIPRDLVAQMLWPTTPIERARHSLRQMIYRLRLAGLPIESDGDALLVAAGEVDCDAIRVLSPEWSDTAAPEEIESKGDFLEAYNADVSDAFREWVDSCRSRVSAQIRRAALKQVSLARREGRWVDLERWGEFVLRFDPLNEEAILARAESRALGGSKSLALAIIDQYVEDLGGRADQLSLPARVLRRRISERAAGWSAGTSNDVALVGRTSEMSRLSQALNDARGGHGSAILLYGAPGIGKSRLVEELTKLAVIEGVHCIADRSHHTDSSRPLALAVRLARALLNTPGVAGTAPIAFGLLSRLSTPVTTDSPLDALAGGPTTVESLAWGFAEAIGAASAESTIMLALDDLHHADELSLQILARIAAASGGLRILILGTRRSSPMDDAVSAARTLTRFTPLLVAPLTPSFAEVLVDQLDAKAPGDRRGLDKSAVVAAGGGNPLFLVELAAHQHAGHSLAQLPESLMQTIAQRLADLGADEIRVLRSVAVLGSLATLPRLRALDRTYSHNLAQSIERLEASGILSSPAPGRLALHECWQQSIRASLGAALSATIAHECAESLLTEETAPDHVETHWRAAELFEAAGDLTRARRAYFESGRELVRRGATRAAAAAFSSALRSAPSAPERLAIAAHLAGALQAGAQYSEALSVCRAALAAAPSGLPGTATARTRLLALEADSAMKSGGDKAPALAEALASLRDAELEDEVRQEACLYLIRIVLTGSGVDEVADLVEICRAAARRSGLSPFGALVELILAAEFGSMREAVDAANLVANLKTDAVSPLVRSLILRYRAINLRWLGEFQEAESLALQARAIAAAIGARGEAAHAAQFLAFMYLDCDKLSDAERWIKQAAAEEPVLPGSERQRSLSHANGRLLLQSGRDDECFRLFADQIDHINADPLVRRRTVDKACIALSACRSGRLETALPMLNELALQIQNSRPNSQLDLAVDCVLAAHEFLGTPSEVRSLCVEYVDRRAIDFDRPVAVALHRLYRLRFNRTPI